VLTCRQRGADRERRDGVGGVRSAATVRSCGLARRRGGAADWRDGEGELRIDAMVRWGRGRRRDGKGSVSANSASA
jgi:hypothetical protein